MSAPPLSNTFEGGSDGTVITVGNSGGGSGDAFDTVDDGSSFLTFEADQARGTLSCKYASGGTGAAGRMLWSTLGSITGDFFGRMYVYHAAAPSANCGIFEVRNSTPATSFRIMLTTGNFLRALDSAAATLATYATASNTSAWWRLEFMCNTSTGAWEVRLYNDPDSATITGSAISGTGASLNTNVNDVRMGVQLATLTNYTIYFDNLALSTSGWIGPADAGGGPSQRFMWLP